MRNLGWMTFGLGLMTSAGALAQQLPFRGEDLKPGERFDTRVHAVTGQQDQGKDVGVVRHVGDNRWTNRKAVGQDGSQNNHYLIYGKPFYAMQSGTVVRCWRNAPENPPNDLHQSFKDGRITGDGNHVWVLQDDGTRALYAHAKPGTVPQSLCPHSDVLVPVLKNASGAYQVDKNGYRLGDKTVTFVTGGARVSAGQKLGEVGNSGSSSGPHLHMHMETLAEKPVVMRFARGLTTSFANRRGSIDGPWRRLAGGELPRATILVWPPRTAGNAVWNGIGAAAFQRTFEHFTDSGMMPDTISCRNDGKVYDTTWVLERGGYIAHHRMSPSSYALKNAQYSSEGWTLASAFRCGSVVAAIWRK